jgi:hypothetical protein
MAADYENPRGVFVGVKPVVHEAQEARGGQNIVLDDNGTPKAVAQVGYSVNNGFRRPLVGAVFQN